MKKLIVLFVVLATFGSCQKNYVIEPVGDDEKDTGNNDTSTKVEWTPRKDILLNDEEKGMILSGNEFAFDLFRNVTSSKVNNNICLSPYSVSLAISMLNNGTAGTTREELLKTLKLDAYSIDNINQYYKKMAAALTEVDPAVTMAFANSIWVKSGIPLLEPFVNVNKNSFQAEIKNVDFSLPATLTDINNWCSEKTNGKIPTILDELPALTQLCILNALYLKGPWSEEFRKEDTAEEPFTNADGTKVSVRMMNGGHGGGFYENEQLSMLELPLGNEAFALLFVLPKEGVVLSSVIDGLNGKEWKNWLSEVNKSSHEVTVKLPRFKIENNWSLDGVLKQLGMKSAFDAADFSGLSSQPLGVSTVIQKTFLNVEEEGVEAAGITMELLLGANDGDIPVKRDFFVNHPFLYMIKEKSSGSILFIGQVSQL